jgi:hypothetical protein
MNAVSSLQLRLFPIFGFIAISRDGDALAAVRGREADIIFARRLVSGAYGFGFLMHEG